MTEWLDPDNLEDPENTTQYLLNEQAYESYEITGQVKFWPVGLEVGNVRNKANCHPLRVTITNIDCSIMN